MTQPSPLIFRHCTRLAAAVLLLCSVIEAQQKTDTETIAVDSPSGKEAASTAIQRAVGNLEDWLTLLENQHSIRGNTSGAGGQTDNHALLQTLPESTSKRECPSAVPLMRSMQTQIRRVRKTIDSIRQWESEREIPHGRTRTLIQKARAFSVERKNRHLLQTHIEAILETIDTWLLLQPLTELDTHEKIKTILEQLKQITGTSEAIKHLREWRASILETFEPNEEDDSGQKKVLAHIHKINQVRSTPHQLTAQLHKHAKDARDTIREINAWQRNQYRTVGNGDIGDLVQKANLFPLERRNRRKLENAAEKLAKPLQKWGQARQTQNLRRLQRLSTLLDLLSTVQSQTESQGKDEPQIPENRERFEYYELQKPRTLPEVSGLTEVYGNPEQWRDLLPPNRGKVADKDQLMPKGTVLIVPRNPVGGTDPSKEQN